MIYMILCMFRMQLCHLGQYETQLDFSESIKKFRSQGEYNTPIVECMHVPDNLPHLLHVKYLIDSSRPDDIVRLEEKF